MFSAKIRNIAHLNTEKRSTAFFTILTRILTLVFLIIGTFEFIPAWILRDPGDDVHLWHIAELTAIAMLIGSIFFALSYRPHTKPLLAQCIILGMTALGIGIIPFSPGGIAPLLIAVLVILTYPDRHALLNLKLEGRVNVPLVVITVLFAAFLIPIAQREVYWQILGMAGGDAHALYLHWIGSALLYVLLILAGGLSATKQLGWKALTVAVGVTYCYLGLTAMLVPSYAGSWGETGGLFAILGGVLYVLFMLVEAESMRVKEQDAHRGTPLQRHFL